MKEYLNNYKPIGKFLTIFSLIILILGIIASFVFPPIKWYIVGIAMSTIIDYIAMQYFSTEEYWNKVMGGRIHKKSRNLFALAFAFTGISLSLGVIHIISKINALYMVSAGLMIASIACVFNEYGIDGEKKKKGILACIVVAIALIMLIYLCKTQLGW